MAAKDLDGIDFQAENDEGLLIYMSLRDDDQEAARAAWAVFHLRHIDYVYRKCWRVLFQFLRGRYDSRAVREMAKDLSADVMLKVFNGAKTFNLKGSRELDQMRRQVRAWMGTIAYNTVCEWLSARQHETGSVGFEDLDEQTTDNGEAEANPVLDCVRRIIESLPDKERMVILAYMGFYDPKKGGGRLSNDEAKQLALALNLNTASLRQIKKRVLQRLRGEIDSKCLGESRRDAL